MKYLLKNKDKVVLEFEVEKDIETFKGQTISYVSLKDASIMDKTHCLNKSYKAIC
ncbi:hypothetical protein [Helicobacter rodentium]|uniref:hypothetical protein n=1 Tax=Helicobacter rodentium TaxID=59617 RepID=UPI0023F3A33B|nr:hypothetical protein [Helicobacter rodentium]